jgi:hypothetical protein
MKIFNCCSDAPKGGLLASPPSYGDVRSMRGYTSRNPAKTHQRSVYQGSGIEDRSAAVSRARELDLL